MKRPTPVAIALIALATVAVAACSNDKTTATPPASPAASAATFPVTEDGTTVTARPTHIISLSPTATDILFSIGAGAQVIEVDKNSNYFGAQPPAQTPPADVDAYKPNAEAIAAKSPDLVVIASDQDQIKEQLTALKIPVYVAPAAVTIDDTYLQETALGALTGNVSGAAKVVSDEKAAVATELAKVPTRATKLTYYYELDPTFYSVTSKTFIGSLFTMAGLTNIADPSDADGKAGGYPQLSAETIVKANPDLIFLADTICCQQTQATVAGRPGWSTLTAVKNQRVVGLDDNIASQWGTRIPELLDHIVTAETAVPAA